MAERSQALPAAAWREITIAQGSQGPRVYRFSAVPRQLYLPVGVNQFCRFTSSAWPRCWAASVR